MIEGEAADLVLTRVVTESLFTTSYLATQISLEVITLMCLGSTIPDRTSHNQFSQSCQYPSTLLNQQQSNGCAIDTVAEYVGDEMRLWLKDFAKVRPYIKLDEQTIKWK